MSEYNTVAPFYDWILYPFMRGIRREVLGIVQDLKPGRIIDVCCGTGDQLRLLRKNGIEALGIDLSGAMLNVADRGRSAPRCLLQDATAMAFRNQSFDMATVSFALHETQWENAQTILQEIHRILKPSGLLLIADYELSPKSGFFAQKAIQAIEFMAGQQHYDHFIHYNQKGGLDKLITPDRFMKIEDRFHGLHSIVIRLLRKK